MGKYKPSPRDMRNFITDNDEYPDYERFSSFCEFVYDIHPDVWWPNGMESDDLQKIYQGFLAGVLAEWSEERGSNPPWEKKK